MRSAAMFAARTQPALTCQVLEGRFRSPMALAVRTAAGHWCGRSFGR